MDFINKTHNIIFCPDEIHNEFLKQILNESIRCLLNVYNNIWMSDTFPETCTQMTIVPIPQTGNDTSHPQNLSINYLARLSVLLSKDIKKKHWNNSFSLNPYVD